MKITTPKPLWLATGIGAIMTVAFVISCATIDRVIVAPAMIPGATYVGMETCAMCHEQEAKDFHLTAHANLRLRADADEPQGSLGCEACHGPGSLHVEAGGLGQILRGGKNPDSCLACHLETKMQFHLPYKHPVLEGKMSCNDCHDPHGDDIHNPKGMFVSRVNQVCAQCHREQARPRVFEHEAMREGCTTCHQVHGSINDKMLTERDNNLCLKCHGEVAAQGVVGIGGGNHASRVRGGACFSAGCHTAVHGSDINPHLRY